MNHRNIGDVYVPYLVRKIAIWTLKDTLCFLRAFDTVKMYKF